ncbi:MAG: mechanosensitive ion channel family protein [Candidatus Undinarchaeales archaeon]
MSFESIILTLENYIGILSQYPYLYALSIFISFLVIAKGIELIFEHFLVKAVKKTNSKIDDLIVKKIKTPITLILILIGIRLAAVPIDLSETMVTYFDRGLSTIGFVIAILVSIAVFDVLIENWSLGWAKRRKKIDKSIIHLLQKISRVTVAAIGLMFILNAWGINASPLLASLGVAGLAVAFAMQKTLGNFFGGISLVADKAVKVDDVIELSTGEIGTIVDVGLRSTKLKTFDNEVITVPNGILSETNIKNFALPGPTARLVLSFGVAYGSSVEKVKKIVLNAIEGIKGISKEPEPFVRFSEMGDSALKFKAYIWVDDYRERFSIKDIANTNIYNALNKAGIIIPFPQMDVHLKKK